MKIKGDKIRTGSGAGHVIGRAGFAKISAVEGIRVSPGMRAEFRSYDKAGLTAPERRRRLTEKYGKGR